MSQEDDHLQLLAIFHYVVAGMAALASLFPTIHLLVGIGLLTVGLTDPKVLLPMQIIGGFFILFASCWISCGLVFAACLALAGRSLQRRRNYNYCLVMAGTACMLVPFGTILGVLTILVLMKEGTKAQFPPARPPTAQP